MKINWFLKLEVLMMCLLLFAACSSDEETLENPSFPEKQEITIAAGDTITIEFEASHEWRMASNKSWVRFLMGDLETPIAYGSAGKSKATVIMKTNGLNFTSESANLSLTMNKQSKVVFDLTRPGLEREALMILRNGTALDTITQLNFAYKGSYQIGFQANYDWKITVPEWVTPLKKITGKAGEEVTIRTVERLYLSDEVIPYEKHGEFVLEPRDGNGPSYRFPIVYAGMDANLLTMSPSRILISGLLFSHDRFYYANSGSSITPTTDKEVSFSFTSRNMDYRIAVVEYDMQSRSAKEIAVADSWLSYTEASPVGNLTLSLKSNNTSKTNNRVLYFYILPPEYKEGYDYSKDFQVVGKNVVFNSKVGFSVTQESIPLTEGFLITGGLTAEELEVQPVKVTDPSLVAQYGTENIYSKAFTKEEWDAPGVIKVKVHGLSNGFIIDFADKTSWARTVSLSSMTEFSISSRVSFNNLPSTTGAIVIKTAEGKIHGVLLINKAN